MNTEITIYTLGKLIIEQNGQVVENLISTKAALLLAYLAMHPGEHSRKKLAALLWSETSDQQALKNLRTVLSSIRQEMPRALVIERDALMLNDSIPIILDARLFEKGCEKAFSPIELLDVGKTMQEIMALYQGDFLEGITVRDAEELDGWISEQQRHFQRLYRQLLFEYIELTLKQAHYEVGLAYAWKLVSLDPLWDAAQRQLIRLLAYANRSSEALLQYERFAHLLDEELGTTPDTETIALIEQIRTGNLQPTKPAAIASIALPDMPFVEPQETLEIAQRMLGTPQCRLLTVFGISGIGKTALVTQIAYHRQHLYPDGVYLISLKHTHSGRDLPYLIAVAVGMDLSSTHNYSALERTTLDHIKNRKLLLVLDNYEYILPETNFVENLLEQAPQIQVVITSQMPLNLFREWLLPLTGLSCPPEDDIHPETYEAVRLFELTAQRNNPRFNLQNNLSGVARICRLVDGLPLALVIAAGWTQILPIHKIIDHILEGQEFSLPYQQNMPAHHQSMEMMLEYTWSTLNEAEKQTLTALSIFNSTFDLEEAEQICAVDITALISLIQRSLIQKYDDKYRMHQLVWRHARKKLLYSDQREALGKQYLDFYQTWLAELQKQNLLLHEYLLAIEIQYPSIWNYDWMVKSFQPIYMLSISQHLMVYWEISRVDAIADIRRLFETINLELLPPEMRLVLYLQLARLFLWHDQTDQAYQYLAAALQNYPQEARWQDLALLYYFYASLFHVKTQEIQIISGEPFNEDAHILRKSYLKLALLYLDTGEKSSADEVFQYLAENSHYPIHHALIHAIRGAIAAESHDYSAAASLFSRGLLLLDKLEEPRLTASLHANLMRVKANET
ncbi:MAG: AAA family ATPase [Chloroflexi bacterium]|nr:AAA family ATPase [Chloroflexota bacterium]